MVRALSSVAHAVSGFAGQDWDIIVIHWYLCTSQEVIAIHQHHTIIVDTCQL